MHRGHFGKVCRERVHIAEEAIAVVGGILVAIGGGASVPPSTTPIANI